jgi:toxin ParE1/3/4
VKVLWTAEAKADLIEIGAYIQADNPPRAASFIREIIAAGDSIAEMPRAFPLVLRYEERGVRRRRYGRYLIFYRITRASIEVLHVLHGARDYERLLFADD